MTELLACASCGLAGSFELSATRLPRIQCAACDASLGLQGGVVDARRAGPRASEPGYRRDGWGRALGALGAAIAPAAEIGVWGADPLRLIDAENRALGRARGGTYLRAPVRDIGALLARLGPHDRIRVIGVDPSRASLERAARRAERAHIEALWIRAARGTIPVRPGSVDSLFAPLGALTLSERASFLASARQALRPGGFFSGHTIVRLGPRRAELASATLERYGLQPMPHSSELLVADLREAGFARVRFQTQGARMFFEAERGET